MKREIFHTMDIIHNDRELEFAIFCVENVALHLGIEAEKVYDALHTQGKDYIVEDILAVMKEQGVTV